MLVKHADTLITIQDFILGEGAGCYHQKGSKVCVFGDYELVYPMRRDLYHCQNGAIGGEGYVLILDEGFGNRNGNMDDLHVNIACNP